MIKNEEQKETVIGIIAAMYEKMIRGCSNHGCLFNPVKDGMKTNSICRCSRDIDNLNHQLQEAITK